MGYAHSWVVKYRTVANVPAIIEDVRTLTEIAGIPLQRSVDDPSPPTFGPGEVRFNAQENGCEDFRYPPQWTQNADLGLPAGYGWCKTDELPYDAIVGAAVLAMKHHLADDVVTRSDGMPDSPAWMHAAELYQRAFPDRSVPVLDNWPGRSGRTK